MHAMDPSRPQARITRDFAVPPTPVTKDFAATEDGTRLAFVPGNLHSDESAAGHRRRWGWTLDPLARCLEGRRA
jgi:hypothetical protein